MYPSLVAGGAAMIVTRLKMAISGLLLYHVLYAWCAHLR